MEILTVNQASQYCRVSPQTIVNWINSGKLKAYKTAGGHRRIQKVDLDLFLKEHEMPAFDIASESAKEASMSKRILVVDDDPVIVETLTAALEEDEHGYEVLSAKDGFEAGIQVSHFRPDLLILDIMMPDIDGYEVCRRVKTSELTKHTKVIVLSGYLDDENYQKMREYGADKCFSKPLPLDELRQEIDRLLY